MIDVALCEGNGHCVAVAPEIFTLGQDDVANVLDASMDDAMRDAAELAVRRCPRNAISVGP